MLEIRFHGRGGQGAVTSAELMAQTAIGMGKYAQAFPSFGPERRGAPVTAFLRISEKPIRIREKVYEPNVVVVLDPTVMSVTKVDQGLKPDGLILINTTHPVALLRSQFGFSQKIATIDAMSIALEILKVPITNTVMLGAFSKVLGQATPEDVKEPFNHRFGPSLAPKNLEAFQRAFDEAKVEGSL
ncbi:MAG: 2-oxoacid:acceptor oxidoreductase family protein [Deltaproteobacteria bacterium]|jgi:pyruvate ferredoxin oxidoreductase gamma subunit|nr:2-oxoacid:acceptor oxidoreductase family protein [Deltaproteobacteria bacterium]MDR1308914.1 2-oxoacid:acceptor oxidoreductase family protein [Deltaproteobacteria bacterium]